MVRACAVMLGLACAIGQAQAASTPQVWQGEAFVTAVTGACATNNTAAVADYFRLIYRPKLASTDPAEGLSFVGARSTYLATAAGGSLMFQGTNTYSGRYISSRAVTGSSTGTASLSISPLPVLTGTSTITISGTITNFFAVTGCSITFRSASTARP